MRQLLQNRRDRIEPCRHTLVRKTHRRATLKDIKDAATKYLDMKNYADSTESRKLISIAMAGLSRHSFTNSGPRPPPDNYQDSDGESDQQNKCKSCVVTFLKGCSVGITVVAMSLSA